MGFLSFRRSRKAPSPLAITGCPPIPQHQSTILDQFSQEVGSAGSASSWVIPDIINRRVEEQPFSPSALQSPKYNINGFRDAPLGLRGGNMDDFDDCDPKSPTASEMYQDWTDQDSQDEQSSSRRGSQESLQSIRQVSPSTESGVNSGIGPQSPQQVLAQHPAATKLHPQAFRSTPSIDDSDDDEELDAFSRRCEYRLNRTLIIGPDENSGDGVDSDDETDVRVDSNCANSSRARTVCHESSLLDRNGVNNNAEFFEPPITCYWTSHPLFQGADGLDDDQVLHSRGIYCSDSVVGDNEEAADDRVGFRDLPHLDGYVITCRSPNHPIGANMDDHEYDADFEGSQTMWNSNRAILQGSDLTDYEDFENWSQTWDPNALESPNGPNTEAFRFFSASELRDRPASTCSVYEDASEELPNFFIYPSLFSPSPVCNDDAHYQYELLSFEQYLYNPFSPAGCRPFSSDFARPMELLDIHLRLQSPPEFNYSWVNPDPHCECKITSCGRVTSIHGVPDPAPTIFDWAAFGYHSPRIAMCYGRPQMLIFKAWFRDPWGFTYMHTETPFHHETFGNSMHDQHPFTLTYDERCFRARETFANRDGNRFSLTAIHNEPSFACEIFGNGTSDRFPFTFTSDEPPFPPQACFCKHGMHCSIHPLGCIFRNIFWIK